MLRRHSCAEKGAVAGQGQEQAWRPLSRLCVLAPVAQGEEQPSVGLKLVPECNINANKFHDVFGIPWQLEPYYLQPMLIVHHDGQQPPVPFQTPSSSSRHPA